MSIDATVIAQAEKFRIVKAVDGEKVTYTLEKHSGFDALGVERWLEIRLGGTTSEDITRQLRDYIIRLVNKEQP